MPVNVIGTLKPKNNGKFPVAEAVDIKVTDDLRLDEALENKADLSTVEFGLNNKADKTETKSLQAQINEIIEPVTQDAEVQNARVDLNGTVYTTLKERLDASGQNTQTDIEQTQSGYTHFPETNFIHGNIAMDGSVDTSYTSKIVMENINTTSEAIELTIAENKALVYATYDINGNKLTREASIIDSLLIPANTRFRISIYPTTGEILTDIADIAEYARTVTFESETSKRISFLEGNGSVSTNKIINGSVTPEKTSFIIQKPDTNCIRGWVDNTYINKDGVETPYEGWYSTTPVILKPNTQYYWKNLYSGYYTFYAADDTVIESHATNDPPSNPFTTPSNIAYARFTAITDEQKASGWVSTKNTAPQPYANVLIDVDTNYSSNPCDYNESYISAFNKCLCIGDSLTYGVFNHNESGTTEYTSDPTKSYPAKLEKLTGIECINEGLASATFDEWYDAKKTVLTSGYDMAIIQLGVNDRFRYDGWTTTAETALNNIISDLQAANEGIKIFVSTIIPTYSSAIYDEISQGIRDAVAAINDPNVILLDIAEYSHTKDNEGFNAGHLSELGYTRLAMDYRNYISWVISTNMLAFRNIQFIGTEYYYN